MNHNNYYFLARLCPQLQQVLQNALFVEGYSTSKSELWLQFKLNTGNYFALKLNFIQADTLLSFPTEFNTPKQKHPQYKQLQAQQVVQVVQQPFERSFYIQFANGAVLLLKLFGKNGNVLLYENQQLTDVFRRQIKADLVLDYATAVNAKHFAVEEILNTTPANDVAKQLPFFPPDAVEALQNGAAASQVVQQLKQGSFFICKNNNTYQLRFFSTGEELGSYTQPIDALNDFARLFLGKYFFDDKKQRILQRLYAKRDKLEKEITSKKTKLKKIETQTPYKHMADILMANLYQLQKGQTLAKLHNFYNDAEVEIKLKKDLTPQENAEGYYRKAKNQVKEEEILKQNLLQAEDELFSILQQIEDAEKAADSKQLRGFEKDNKEQLAPAAPSLFKEFPFKGYTIWVGKNSQNNDLLTMKHAAKNDIWLHARGMAGSHVVIKTKAGQTLPTDVLEYAASLAAYFSKGRTDSLCPVIYTEKKYVRKIKGAPAGQVVVDKENTLLVKPAFINE